MKHTFCTLALLAVGFTAPLCAQVSLRSNIPFPFEVAGGKLPAGSYKVVRHDDSKVQISIARGNIQAILWAFSWQRFGREPDEYKLIFHRYGDRYFLREVQFPAVSAVIPKSRQEHEVVTSNITAQNHPQRVEVLAVLR